MAEKTEFLSFSGKASAAVLQERLDFIAGRVLEILCELNLDAVVRSVHPSVEGALGYHAETLVGMNALDFVHPEDRAMAEEALLAFRLGQPTEIEVRIQRADGGWAHMSCFGGVLLDDAGNPQGLLIGGRNISKRKMTETALKRMETRFQSVWEKSREAMRLIDGNGIVVQVNDAYCRLVKRAREDLEGAPYVSVYGYADPEAKMREFRERFATRTLRERLDSRVPLWTGEERIFQLSNSFLQVEDRPLLLTIFRDVTARQRKEEELKELNEKLRQRADQLGALTLQLTRAEQLERRRLAQIVHDDLQQLLVATRMAAERVRKRIGDAELMGEALEVEELLDESIRASRSITTELSPPILQDGGLIPALEWLARRMREMDQLDVRLRAEPEAEPPAEALRFFLFQAVKELLFNCYKHSGRKKAEVSVSRIAGERIEIVVEDSGRGFEYSRKGRDGAAARDCFGLFSIEERIGHIGGEMRVESSDGNGARITLIAPFQPPEKESENPEMTVIRKTFSPPESRKGNAAVEEDNGGRIRLVLVDDHKLVRQGLRELLREQPDMVVVGEAENGLAGLKLVQELQPDLVILDVTMPVMNGIEVARVIAKELPEIKIIGLSMHEKEDMADAMLEAGAAAYVTKSAASDTLTATIRECVGIGCRN